MKIAIYVVVTLTSIFSIIKILKSQKKEPDTFTNCAFIFIITAVNVCLWLKI